MVGRISWERSGSASNGGMTMLYVLLEQSRSFSISMGGIVTAFESKHANLFWMTPHHRSWSCNWEGELELLESGFGRFSPAYPPPPNYLWLHRQETYL